MTIITPCYRSFEDEVLTNLNCVPQPGDIIHSFGEFVVIPPKRATQELHWSLTSNTTTSINIEKLNVKLA
jgi:hypothetical protein